MKTAVLPALLLTSCASITPDGGDQRELENMERKMIAFQEKYDRFDHNGDGYLTRKELSSGLVNENVQGIPPNEVPKIFAYYDTNRDNRISLSEINAAYEAGPRAALKAQKTL